jgi:hypothetical protein
MGFEHGHRHMDQHLTALDHGHRHPQGQPSASPPPQQQGGDMAQALMHLLASGEIEFTRDKEGRIGGMRLKAAKGERYPTPRKAA